MLVDIGTDTVPPAALIVYDLVDIIIEASNNPNKYIEMGLRAKSYYDSNATPEHMAQGAIDAINFVLNK